MTALLGLLLLLLPASVNAQFSYGITNNEVTIRGYTGAEGDVIIPDTIEGFPVIAIAIDAFWRKQTLQSITLPNTVRNIGLNAFGSCSNLISVTLGNNVTNIETYAFARCVGLRSMVIPPSVITISSATFWECVSLTNVTLGENVELIGSRAFEVCTSLTSIAIPDHTKFIDQNAFRNCSSLTNVIIGNGVTNINWYAFVGCSNLTSLTLGTNLAIISDHVFEECRSLPQVYIPASVTNIGVGSFRYCDALASIEVAPDNPAYCSVDGVLFTKDQSMLFKYPPAKSPSYTIPGSVTAIGVEAFRNCRALTNVVIPGSVTDIQRYVFEDCVALTNLTIPASVTNIGTFVFRRCEALQALQFWGNAPAFQSSAFDATTATLTVYIREGTSGWPVPPNPWNGKATAFWQQTLRPAMILPAGGGVIIGPNGFGFTVTGVSNATLVVEAASNPAAAVWTPLETNAIPSGTMTFYDPAWTNQAMRFYRVRQQ